MSFLPSDFSLDRVLYSHRSGLCPSHPSSVLIAACHAHAVGRAVGRRAKCSLIAACHAHAVGRAGRARAKWYSWGRLLTVATNHAHAVSRAGGRRATWSSRGRLLNALDYAVGVGCTDLPSAWGVVLRGGWACQRNHRHKGQQPEKQFCHLYFLPSGNRNPLHGCGQ